MSGTKVDPEVLRVDISRWDEISAAFNSGVEILENEDVMHVFFALDSLTRTETDWNSWYVTQKCAIQNFSLRGKDAIGGAHGIGIFGVDETLRTLANLYEQTDADASVTFDQVAHVREWLMRCGTGAAAPPWS